jgi:hypothetical protein
MNPLSPIRILRIVLAGAAAFVLAAPAGAHMMRVNEGDSSMVAQYGWGAAATVAKGQSNDLLAQYGWGAAATFAKQQTRAALAASADNDLLAQYGWGAAAAYAKLHA